MTIKDNSYYCCYCGARFSERVRCTVDHLIPLSKGGANNPYNKRNCCDWCNQNKSNILPHDMLPYLLVEASFCKSQTKRYDLEIKIENLKYIIDYINTAGPKLFKNHERFEWFRRRYLKDLTPVNAGGLL